MVQDFTEERLVARAREGDDAAFAELVRRHYPRVRALMSRGAPGIPVDEALAQAFAYAARHVAEADPCRFGEWIDAVALRHLPRARTGVVAEPRAAYGLPDAPPAEGAAPDRVIVMGDYFQARRGFASDEALAAACGFDPWTVRRMRAGTAADPAAARLLGDVAAVVRRLLDHYDAGAVADWLLGRSPDLGGRRPVDVLREGGLADVLATVDAQASGAFL